MNNYIFTISHLNIIFPNFMQSLTLYWHHHFNKFKYNHFQTLNQY